MELRDNLYGETGALQRVESQTAFLLRERTGAWRVEAGHVDVFAVRVRDGAPVSKRWHLHRVMPGEMFFGIDEAAAVRDYGLLAVCATETTLRRVDETACLTATRETEQVEEVAHAVEHWVESLCAGVFSGMPPKEHEEPVPGQVLVIQGDACIRSTTALRWVRHVEGRSLLMGRPGMPVIREEEGFVPVGRDVWLVTEDVCEFAIAATAERIEEGAWQTDLAGFHALLLDSIATCIGQACDDEEARLRQKEEASRSAMSGAYAHLASVMATQAGPVVAADDPLLAACRIVGEKMHLEIKPPLSSQARHRRDRLSEIARASRVRTRKVALRGRWWTEDNGPLLGLVIEGEEEQGRVPVALIPEKKGYALHRPETGTVERVDEQLADRLHPFAYFFYRPFKDGALGAWDVFRFGIRRNRGALWTILLMGLASGILGLITPIVTGVIFNTVIPEAGRSQLLQIVCALFACAIAIGLFDLVRGFAVLRVESAMDASVQAAVWDRLLNLPTGFFRRFSAGDLAVRASGISGIRQLLSGATITSLLGGIFSLFNLGLLFYYDRGLALWALGLTVAALMIAFGASYFQLRYQRQVAEDQSKLSGKVLQFITGITKLRVAGAESKAFEIWAKEFSAQRQLQFKARRVGNALSTFNAAFPVIVSMVVFGIMISREDAVMQTGDFVAFNAALGTFIGSMLSMTGAFAAVLMAVPFYEQARPILEAIPEVDTTKADPGELSGAIEVQHVSFRYDPEGPLTLKNVSLEARPGEFVALVGPSGSGKSTVLRLLLGFEEPEAGAVYYDGQDLEGLDHQALRRQVGVVLQSGGLMSGDLFTNITGSSVATMDDAWEAARMAGFDEDIKQMPMGMHTVVSEGGSTLSGGQRQRLMIARAIVNRPRLLFFDEATSALDNRTQAVVSESLERLQATRIVVAHRLSTIMNADRIYVIDKGQVVQQGTYEALLHEGGVFGELARRQLA